MEWWNIFDSNRILIINLVSVEIGLIVGIWFRSLLITKTPLNKRDAAILGLFTVILGYGTTVATFSAVDWPSFYYAVIGVISVPFAVPLYTLLIQSAPSLIQSIIPSGLLKWFLEHSKGTTVPPQEKVSEVPKSVESEKSDVG